MERQILQDSSLPLQSNVANRTTNQEGKNVMIVESLLTTTKSSWAIREKDIISRNCANTSKHTAGVGFGNQCFNIHKVNYHMNTSHVQRQGNLRQERWSNIRCKNGPSCVFKAQNRCNYSHKETNVPNVRNSFKPDQASTNTSAFNMRELLERLERLEQHQVVPNVRSIEDFPNVQESNSKRKTA